MEKGSNIFDSFLCFHNFKFLNHITELLSLAKGKDIPPVMVEIDPVNFCNHKCIWCSDFSHSNAQLDKRFVERLLEDLAKGGVKSVLFKGGGEPLLHPDLPVFLEKAYNLRLSSAIVTNGSCLDKEKIESIVKFCKGIRISLDAVNEKQHKALHRPSSAKFGFNQIKKGVIALVEERNRHRSELLIGLNFCFNHKTYKDVHSAVKVAKELSVDYIGLRRIWFENRLFGKILITPEVEKKMCNIFQEVKAAEETHHFAIFVDSFKGKTISSAFTYRECLAFHLSPVVGADKHVYPCCALRYMLDFSFGKIENSFWDVWKGEKRKLISERCKTMVCQKYCANRFEYYNQIISYLKSGKPHGEFI